MAFVYFIIWLIFNGRITLEIILVGLCVSVAADVSIKKIMRVKVRGGTFFKILKLFPVMAAYFIVLVIEIVKANIMMTRLTLAKNIEVEPCLVKMHTDLKSQAARVTLANSITLTPGTITVSLEGNELLVHSLNHDIANGLNNSIFERLLKHMEVIARA